MKGLLIDLLGAMLALSGAGSPEELSEYETERFAYYAEHPLQLNRASRSRMLASGLFSAYQLAALEEYRRRSGDILSLTELGLVDGIGPQTAEALGWFVSFESSRPPGVRERSRVNQSLMMQGAVRIRDCDTSSAAGIKYHIQIGERAEFFWSSRTSYSAPEPVPGTFSLALSSKRGARLIMGDYAARFGQGLALWSSFSMSGFSSVAAFRRNASGFAPTGSFSPALRGAAIDLPLGRWNIGAAGALADGAVWPMAAVSYFGRRGQFGLQALCKDGSVISADGNLGLGHWTLFGEAALSSVLISSDATVIRRTRAAALGGVNWAPAYRVRLAALARYYPSGFYSPFAGAVRSASKVSDEAGFALGAQWRWAECTFDAARHPEKGTSQYKGILSLAPEFTLGGTSFTAALRCTERFRPEDKLPWRHEARLDLKASHGPFSAVCRGDLVRCKDYGALAYSELGYQRKSEGRPAELSAFARATLFRADAWDDRIYCYERDLPGAFSVPACYGRGWEISLLARVKFGVAHSRHSLCFKSSYIRQTAGKRPSSAEFKLQYQLSI